jgi:hypothetical protein
MRICKDFADANEKDIIDSILQGELKGKEEYILQLKGQILAFRAMLNIKELILDEQESNYEDIQSIRAESLSEGEENI